MAFLKTLLTIIMIFYVIKIVTRFAAPIFLKRFMSKMEDKMRQQQGFNDQYDESNVGKTVIDKKAIDKTSNKNVGEYVDYEEVE